MNVSSPDQKVITMPPSRVSMPSLSVIALQAQDRQWGIYAHKRRMQQTRLDAQTSFTGFWENYDPDNGLHTVQLPDGGKILCSTITNSGFKTGETITVRRPFGSVFGMATKMPRV